MRRRIRRLEQENEVLRRAAAHLSQANLPGRIYPLVRDLAASGIPAEVSPQVLSLGRWPCYRWLTRPVTDSELREAYLANAIHDAHCDDPEFGYRFLCDAVTDAGHEVSERTVSSASDQPVEETLAGQATFRDGLRMRTRSMNPWGVLGAAEVRLRGMIDIVMQDA